MKWLRENHPEFAAKYPAYCTGSNDDSDKTNKGYPSSLTDSLCYLPVASPAAILTPGSSMETGDEITNDEATSGMVECNEII